MHLYLNSVLFGMPVELQIWQYQTSEILLSQICLQWRLLLQLSTYACWGNRNVTRCVNRRKEVLCPVLRSRWFPNWNRLGRNGGSAQFVVDMSAIQKAVQIILWYSQRVRWHISLQMYKTKDICSQSYVFNHLWRCQMITIIVDCAVKPLCQLLDFEAFLMAKVTIHSRQRSLTWVRAWPHPAQDTLISKHWAFPQAVHILR